tara:strand:- start:12440 stop:13009 length:570 start_codon:yes stop_codon:yes gene_type:complete
LHSCDGFLPWDDDIDLIVDTNGEQFFSSQWTEGQVVACFDRRWRARITTIVGHRCVVLRNNKHRAWFKLLSSPEELPVKKDRRDVGGVDIFPIRFDRLGRPWELAIRRKPAPGFLGIDYSDSSMFEQVQFDSHTTRAIRADIAEDYLASVYNQNWMRNIHPALHKKHSMARLGYSWKRRFDLYTLFHQS